MQHTGIVIWFRGPRHLGDAIRIARQRQGLTQEQLAEAMDCADRTIRRIEAGVQGVELRQVQEFARVLADPKILKRAVEEITRHMQDGPTRAQESR